MFKVAGSMFDALMTVRFLVLAFLLVLALQSYGAPNVLMIVVDDMKDWTGYQQGYEGTVHTPNIDRLAARGRPFLNAHCPSPKCGPSRCSILTGKRPSTLGIYGNQQWLRPNYPDLVTLPHHFKENGYLTAGAGKIHHHTAGFNPPDQWHQFLEIEWEDPWDRTSRLNYPDVGKIPRPEGHPFSGLRIRHEFDWGSLPSGLGYHDHKTTEFAEQFLKEEYKRPFFLAVGFFRPHLPWYAPEPHFDRYPLDQVTMPPVKEDDQNDLPEAAKRVVKSDEFELIRENEKYREAVQAYLAAISFADAQVGRVLDALETSTHLANTIVVLWSDHGWHLGSKGHWHKWTLWEEATRVPFIVAVPDQRDPGKPNRSPVSLLDLFPTLLNLCEIPSPHQMDGEDLSPLIEDPEADRSRPVVIERELGQFAVRDARYRYIRYADESEELYDLDEDPHEWRNLAQAPEAVELKRRLARFAPEEWKDPVPAKSAFRFDHSKYTWKRK